MDLDSIPLSQSVTEPVTPAVLEPDRKVYLYLFHGRRDVETQMDDWGESGPFLGPFDFVHCTYGVDLKTDQENGELQIVDGLVYYDGWFYGDWSVVADLQENVGVQPFDPAKAKVPTIHTYNCCVCWESGYMKIVTFRTIHLMDETEPELAPEYWMNLASQHIAEEERKGIETYDFSRVKAKARVMTAIERLARAADHSL
jgi:hypothetical protein